MSRGPCPAAHVPRVVGNIPVNAVLQVFNPVGVGVMRSLRTQGAPLVRRPWALLFYAFSVVHHPRLE